MQYFKFIVELMDKSGKAKLALKTVASMHLSGAIRKLYQSYDGVNLVRIL